MTKFHLTIECDNAAFGENEAERNAEIATLLKGLGRRLEAEAVQETFSIVDHNGNIVGRADICGPLCPEHGDPRDTSIHPPVYRTPLEQARYFWDTAPKDTEHAVLMTILDCLIMHAEGER